MIITARPRFCSMIETKADCGRKLKPEDYKVYHDSVGVMHFLPPKRCRDCDD